MAGSLTNVGYFPSQFTNLKSNPSQVDDRVIAEVLLQPPRSLKECFALSLALLLKCNYNRELAEYEWWTKLCQ